ncbi:MAG: hypothetical protein K6F71_08665 [Ruminococcus sp.]|uniref:HNH endonuclease domain-containing protein n=1 Tax=Ruminococcus sp. TaxID=41978 RepID=UPI00344CFC0D|nr:hypothetical protein [Ruminococcus sp.]
MRITKHRHREDVGAFEVISNLLKDDSLENKVLVDSNANGSKGDKYPIDPEILKKMSPFWKSLHEKNMMSDKKFNRLMRNTAFTEDELSGFIARQLVKTRQSTVFIVRFAITSYIIIHNPFR